jgi:hypothetical protein
LLCLFPSEHAGQLGNHPSDIDGPVFKTIMDEDTHSDGMTSSDYDATCAIFLFHYGYAEGIVRHLSGEFVDQDGDGRFTAAISSSEAVFDIV